MPDRVTREAFEALVAPLKGLPISHAQRGYGSALLLDFGERRQIGIHRARTRPNGEVIPERPYIVGEASALIEWDWRVVRRRRILFGSNSNEAEYEANIASLIGTHIEDVSVEGRFIPELCLVLSDGRAIESLATVASQPRWALFLPSRHEPGSRWLKVYRGRVILETDDDNLGADDE